MPRGMAWLPDIGPSADFGQTPEAGLDVIAKAARLGLKVVKLIRTDSYAPSSELPFCPNCGKEYSEGAPFCPSCGRPLQVATASGQPGGSSATQSAPQFVSAIQRPTGVTILAGLQIIGSLITIGVGLLLGIFGVVVVIIGVLTLFFAVSLFSGRNWARILIMIGAVLDIISIVGIIWGAILLYYFTRKHVVAYFKAPK